MRLKTVMTLNRLGDARSVTRFLERLPQEEDPQIRAHLIEGIAAVGEPEDVEAGSAGRLLPSLC